MDKRIKRKHIKNAITNIQKFSLAEDEFLVFKFDRDYCTPAELNDWWKYVKEIVSDKILFVPKETELIKVKEK